MKSVVVWFEIPAIDFDRCQKFYETILEVSLQRETMNGNPMAFFPHEGEAIGGAIIKEEGHEPSANGPLIYLNGGPDLDVILNRVEKAGGKIIMPKQVISPQIGSMGTFLDTEGNRLAVYEAAKR